MKNVLFIFIILLSSFKLLISDCIPNENCLKERGECIDNICECYEEYWTLKSNKYNHLPQMFCNYEKRSRFLPLILEFFLPGLGHLFMRKYLLAIIKIIFLFSTTIIFFTGFQKSKLEVEKEVCSKSVPQNEEEKKLILKMENNNEEKIPLKEDEAKTNEKMNISEFSDEIDNNLGFEKPYKANHEEKPISLKNKVLNRIGFFCLISFFSLYVFDLFAYGFAFYKDSNNVPFL